MTKSPFSFGFDALGSRFTVRLYDENSEEFNEHVSKDVITFMETFEAQYSRFRPHSLVMQLAEKTGEITVPNTLVAMLRLYEDLYKLSRGLFTPLVGRTLESLGYDAEYSLKPKETIIPVPALPDVLRILGDERIELRQPTLFDLGGIGKGYCVDQIADLLSLRGIRRFLIDGSGDIFYAGDGHPLRCGLEHPDDPTKVIGVLELSHGSLCASGANRRRWDKYHHIINPKTLQSPEHILGTWVVARKATLADALATCLFLSEPEDFRSFCQFEYCIMSDAHAVKRSEGFVAELFS